MQMHEQLGDLSSSWPFAVAERDELQPRQSSAHGPRHSNSCQLGRAVLMALATAIARAGSAEQWRAKGCKARSSAKNRASLDQCNAIAPSSAEQWRAMAFFARNTAERTVQRTSVASLALHRHSACAHAAFAGCLMP